MARVEGITHWITPWHGVEATAEEAGEVPDCYTDREWRLFYVAAKASNEKGRYNHSTALKMACEDCQVFYQKEQIKLGNCHPPSFDITPLFRDDDD